MNTTLRALINQAERLVRAGVCEEAVALCHAILRRYPRYARCYRILAEAYLGLAEYEEAAKLFRRALGVDPEDPVPYAGLGIIFEERGLLEEAIWQLERAFELAPGRDELRRELGRLYERRGAPAGAQLTRAALARLYARGGLWNKAIGELRDLLVREPYRLDLRATLARTLWRARRRDEAAELAQAILDQAPNCLVARLILGTCWCQAGRDDEGRALLDGAQELDPENREAARLLARESPLPLRVARVETETDLAASAQEVDDADDLSLWPRAAEARAAEDSGQPPSAADSPDGEGEPRAAEEHIVMLPTESIQALLSDVGAQYAPEPEPGEPSAGELEPAEADGGELAAAQAGSRSPAEGQQGGDLAGPLQPEAPPGLLGGLAGDDAPALLSPVAVLRRRLEATPEDREARLGLARALAGNGELAEALPLYDSLATPASGYLEKILADLEALARAHSQHRALRELMGDAYARAGRFQEAMAMYRWLLARDDPGNHAGG